MHSSLLSCMKIFTSLTLCSSSAISSIKYFYALVELSPQGRKYFISIYFPDTFIFHFPVKHKKHRPRGNRFVRKNSVLSAPSGVRTLDTLIKRRSIVILVLNLLLSPIISQTLFCCLKAVNNVSGSLLIGM